MKITNRLKKIVPGSSHLLAIVPAPILAVAAKTADPKTINANLQKNPIVRDLQDIVNFLSAGVAIVVIGMIMLGGIQYSIAGDNPQKVTDARKRIINAIIALIAFLLIFAFVQWLIPGGLLS